MAQDLASVGKKRHSNVTSYVRVSAPQLKVRCLRGLFKKPLCLSLNLLFLQLLEATHPNPACHMPSHRPFEGGSQAAQMQSLAPLCKNREVAGCSMQSLAPPCSELDG